jgi:hypothetical protein
MHDASSILGVIILLLLAASLILLFHHRYHHRKGGPDSLEGWSEWFQLSDVCNIKSCNHEMWILGMLFTSSMKRLTLVLGMLFTSSMKRLTLVPAYIHT